MLEKIFLALFITMTLYLIVQVKPQPKVVEISGVNAVSTIIA
jgi:hypothetical protein